MSLHEDITEVRGISKKEFFERKGYNWELVEKIIRLNGMYKGIMNAGNDVHHLLARSRGGSNHKINKMVMKKGEHTNHHDYFGVLTPHEQVGMVIELNRRVFMPDIPRRITDIIDSATEKNKIYKPEAYK